MNDSQQAKAIQRRMEEVRCDLDDEVEDIIEHARDRTDWRFYVKTYPWVCLGTALAIGYLVVPRRVPRTRPAVQRPAVKEPAVQKPAVQGSDATADPQPVAGSRSTLLGTLGRLALDEVVSLAWRQAAMTIGAAAVGAQAASMTRVTQKTSQGGF